MAREVDLSKLRKWIGKADSMPERSHLLRERIGKLQERVLPLDRFQGLTVESEINHDLFALARDYGLVLGRAIEDLGTVVPPLDVAQQLGIDADEELLKVERVVRTAAGVPIEWRTTFML